MVVFLKLICHLKIVVHDFPELGYLLQINIFAILSESKCRLHLHLLNTVFKQVIFTAQEMAMIDCNLFMRVGVLTFYLRENC